MGLDSRQKEVLQLIRADSSNRRHFFQKLAEAQEPNEWLGPLREEGYFDAEKNPSPEEVEYQPGFFTVPKWHILGYLENIAKRNCEDPKPEITDFLVGFIDAVLDRERKEKVDNWRTSSSIVKLVSCLPQNKLAEKHIDFVGMIAETKWKSTLVPVELKDGLIPRLLSIKAKDLLLRLMGIILNFKVVSEGGRKQCEAIFDHFWLKKTLDQHAEAIGQLCGVSAADIGITRINRLAERDESEFSVWRIPCVENHEQRIVDDTYAYLVVDFVRDVLLSVGMEQLGDLLNALLLDSHMILRRLAFHTIDRRYDEIGELFWLIEANPLEMPEQHHEVYELLRNNCTKFSKTQLAQVLTWVEAKDYYVSPEAKEAGKEKEAIAWKKKRWLSACAQSDFPLINESFRKYDAVAPGELEHPAWTVWHESRAGGDKSPISEEELLAKENKGIVGYIQTYDGPSESWDGPSRDGLIDCLNKCVAKRPDKFCGDTEPFLQLSRQFQQALLRGFCNALRDKSQFDVARVLGFMAQIIGEEDFWTEQYDEEGYNYRRWMISQVAEFVSDVLRVEDGKREKSTLKGLRSILLLLVRKTRSVEPSVGRLIDAYINDPKGRVFEALISYACQYARRFSADEMVRWEKGVKSVFEQGLARKDDWCLYVTFGRYLPQFMYLDEHWTKKNFASLFPIDDFDTWRMSFAGYLNGHKLYNDLYGLMKEGGHYAKAVTVDFEDEWTNKYLVQSICLAYMLGSEDLQEKSLLAQLVSREDVNQLRELVHYVQTLRDSENIDNKSDRTKDLWRKLFGVLRNHTNDDNFQQVNSNLGSWLGLVDAIDEEVEEWMKFVIDHVNEAWELYSFVEDLLGHVKSKPDRVADTYVHLLDRQKYPDYPQDKIVELVESLYLNDVAKKACTICNKYLKAGYKFLIPVFQRHQQQ
jgi:hypothetical protein